MTPKRETTNNDLGVAVGVLVSKVDEVYKKVEKIEEKLERDYATRDWVDSRFGGTKKIVDGIMWTIAVAVLLAGLSFIIKK